MRKHVQPSGAKWAMREMERIKERKCGQKEVDSVRKKCTTSVTNRDKRGRKGRETGRGRGRFSVCSVF